MSIEDIAIILVSAVGMVICLRALVPFAGHVGLIDAPDGGRKHHEGDVPLIGGPALLLVLLCAALLIGDGEFPVLYWVAIVTVIVGAVDDRTHLSPGGRLIAQLLLASVVVFLGDIRINYLGDLAGTGVELYLGSLSPWISIAAIAAAMNAFNMLDGIDGQAASLGWVAAIGIGASSVLAGQPPPLVVLVLVGAIPAFLLFNLSATDGRLGKCFLGDSGALLIGLLVGTQLITSAQPPAVLLQPISVLWFAALPLFDTLFVMSYRMLHGRSPLSADRNHLHHLLMDYGHSPRRALAWTLLAAIALASSGVLLERFDAPDFLSFLMLFGLFLVYMATALTFHKKRPDNGPGAVARSSLAEQSE